MICFRGRNGYQYNDEVKKKMESDPLYHGFPSSLDDDNPSSPVLNRPDGRIEHLIRGTINGTDGVYHITTSGSEITHRVFIPLSDWVRFSERWGLPAYNLIP